MNISLKEWRQTRRQQREFFKLIRKDLKSSGQWTLKDTFITSWLRVKSLVSDFRYLTDKNNWW